MFDGVLWMDGASLATVEDSFRAAAQELFTMRAQRIWTLNQQSEPLLKAIIASEAPWLFVFDNLDDLRAYDINRFLPKHGLRFTIIASRSMETRSLGDDLTKI